MKPTHAVRQYHPLVILFCLTISLGWLLLAQTSSRPLVLATGSAPDATLTVCNNGCQFSSLQAAINAAASNDTILLMDPLLTEPFVTVNKSVTIQGGNGNAILQAGTTPANGSSRVLTISGPVTVSLADLTLRYGQADQGGGIQIDPSATLIGQRIWVTENTASGDPLQGGGIRNQGTLFLYDSHIVANTLKSSTMATGAGLYGDNGSETYLNNTVVNENLSISIQNQVRGSGIHMDGSLTAINCQVSQNHAWGQAGTNLGLGLFVTGEAALSNCEIDNNYNDANSNTPARGGGIFVYGDVSLFRTVVSGHQIGNGGGIVAYWNSSVLTMTESRVTGNRALGNGGGMQIDDGATVHTYRSTFDNNSAAGDGGAIEVKDGVLFFNDSLIDTGISTSQGGGIFVDAAGAAYLSNSTLARNSASDSGGGIYMVAGGNVGLFSVTASENRADSNGDGAGQGGAIYRGGTAGILLLSNSLIYGNDDESPFPYIINAPDCFGVVQSTGYNLIGTRGSNLANPSSPPCQIPDNNNQFGLDPLLGTLAENGGWTATYALGAGSPAINGGDPAGCLDPNSILLTADQRGFLRPDRCDIGAYEFGGYQLWQLHLPLVTH
ncbi:MAG: right-handed parallel beta-helix repeat-containing protein [Anaerolineales bacterium]|nr:right-handed parallel beta-helix repeat-containing protein [Anaerolineales bacterium]